MKISVRSNAPAAAKADVVVAFARQGKTPLSGMSRDLDRATKGAVSALIDGAEFEGKAGQVASGAAPHSEAGRLVLVGLGEAGKLKASGLRDAVAHALNRSAKAGAKSMAICLPDDKKLKVAERLQAVAEGLELAGYDNGIHVTMNSRRRAKAPGRAIILIDAKTKLAESKTAVARGSAFAHGTNYARTLVNQPSNILNPKALADSARQIAKDFSNVSCTVWGEARILKERMGGLYGVGQGSEQESQFIQLRYSPARKTKKTRTIALVGKGLTFDTGGISIKPSAGMEQMKFDMGGAAAVIGAFRSLAELKPDIEVLGFVAAAENMPDGNAIKPGDVLTMRSGLTVEVNNTDAEGRLVLADALDYAMGKKPDFIVDAATLTGACVIALGDVACGLMSEDDELAALIGRAGDSSGETAWRLPLMEVHRKKMEGHVADLKNTGPRDGGALTAAGFLSYFTKGARWAHLDIAGTVWTETDQPANPSGATGFGARLFATLCEVYSEESSK